MFSFQVTSDTSLIEPLLVSLKDVPSRLEKRFVVPASEYTAILKAKEESYNKGIQLKLVH